MFRKAKLQGASKMSSENRIITLNPAERKTFSIELDANPTTGYQWRANFDSNIFEQLTHFYGNSRAGPSFAGSGGKESWLFGLKRVSLSDSGARKLTFTYFRAWERNSPPARTVIYEVKFIGEQ
jgi:predicted secreted protein